MIDKIIDGTLTWPAAVSLIFIIVMIFKTIIDNLRK